MGRRRPPSFATLAAAAMYGMMFAALPGLAAGGQFDVTFGAGTVTGLRRTRHADDL